MGWPVDLACKLATSRRNGSLHKTRLGVVVVAWDHARSLATLKALDKQLDQAHGVEPTVVVVCNKPELRDELQTRHHLIVGSNQHMDFSGYDEGLSTLQLLEEPAFDVIALINDRMLDYKISHLMTLRQEVLDLVINQRLAVGEICVNQPEPYQVFDRTVLAHLRTNFVLAPASFFTDIGSVTTIDETEFSQRVPLQFPGATWTPSACVNEWLAQFVIDWLTGKTDSIKWHRAEQLSELNWPSIRLKLHTIFNQYALGARFEEENLLLVGTTLAFLLAQLQDGDPRFEAWLHLLRNSPWPAANISESQYIQFRIALSIAWRNWSLGQTSSHQ